jgi:hypothetical protein
MGIGRYAAEMAVKEELRSLLKWIEENEDFNNDPASGFAVTDISEEIERRLNEATEG